MMTHLQEAKTSHVKAPQSCCLYY